MMTQNDAMFNVLTRLQSLPGVQFDQRKLAKSYNILIADLWGGTYTQGWINNNRSCRKDLEERPAAYHKIGICGDATARDENIAATAMEASVSNIQNAAQQETVCRP